MNEAKSLVRRSKWFWLRILLNVFVCAAILAAAAAAIVWINRTEPVAQKINSTRKSSALVDTITVHRGTHSPKLAGLGTVQASQQLRLRPQVSGRVVSISPDFIPGGLVRKGDLLLELDRADFENTVSIRESELRRIEASMEIEEARQRLAKNELELLQGSVDDTNRGLVLREPQIASIKAQIASAQASVDRAKLDLERTKIFAPFDAQVLSRTVNVGSQIGPGEELGLLAGQDEYWVIASVPVRTLRWVQFPKLASSSGDPTSGDEIPTADANNICIEGASVKPVAGDKPIDEETTKSAAETAPPNETPVPNEKTTSEPREFTAGSKALLRSPDAWGPGIMRQANVTRLIGRLDQQSRLARVLITVSDPMGLQSNLPPLIIDSLVQTEIEGKPLQDVIPLKRDYVRDNDTVWVMKDGKLEIRQTEIVFRDAEYAYIGSGLEDGDEVVITTLATVAQGVGLRKIDKNETTSINAPGSQDSDENASGTESK